VVAMIGSSSSVIPSFSVLTVDSGKNKHEKNSFMLWLSRIRKETFKTIKVNES
jgi:hypothetical protein